MQVNTSRPPLLFALFWIGFGTLVTGTFIVTSVYALYRNLLPYTWKVADGVLIESESEYFSEGDYILKVHYRYTVNGREYESTRFDPDFLADTGSRNRVQKMLTSLRQEQPLRVYYNPSNPSEAALRFNPHKSYPFLTWGLGFFLVLVVAAGGSMLLTDENRWKNTIALSFFIGISLIVTGLSGVITAFLAFPGGWWQWGLSLVGAGVAVRWYRRKEMEGVSSSRPSSGNRDATVAAGTYRLASAKTMNEGTGCSLFMAVFGLPFAISGGWMVAQDGRPSAALLFLGFGLMLMWGGLSQAWMHSRAARPEASTLPETITPGKPFRFRFSQRFRRATQVQAADAFLCWREKVRYYDGSETTTKEMDRLVAQAHQSAQLYQGGQTLKLETNWTLPTAPMGLRHPYHAKEQLRVETDWVVKTRLELGKGQELWEEYALIVGEVMYDSVPTVPELQSEARQDVYLTGAGALKMFAITNVMSELLPHLRSGQVGDLYATRPCLLLENVSLAEAEQAKNRLEAVGAEVRIELTAIAQVR